MISLPRNGTLTSLFLIVTAASYGFNCVPTHNPLEKLGASFAIAATSTVAGCAAARVFGNHLIALIIGAGLGFMGADKVAGDILKAQSSPRHAQNIEIEQITPHDRNFNLARVPDFKAA